MRQSASASSSSGGGESHDVCEARARAYDDHYRTAGWRARPWTLQDARDELSCAIESPTGRHINGNEIMMALRRIGAPHVRGKTILDYCCGTGVASIYLTLLGAKVHAFDASPVAIEIASASAKLTGVDHLIDFHVADARDLPFDDAMFDAAFCQSALHIVADYRECSGEAARVLKPGGNIVFCEEALDGNPLLEPIRRLRRRRNAACGGHPLSRRQIEAFGRPFTEMRVYPFNLLGQVKNFWSRHLIENGSLNAMSRRFLWTLMRIDRALLAAAPKLGRVCGKAVIEYIR
ncbi:MAG: class I SAM-dependent methyltransferase [Planctomycetes bacterium]|nr:class I SAM-dependent methyltransferase [Planctomycetota bacterium]